MSGLDVEEIWYGSSATARATRTALAPFSAVFGAGAAARGLLYDRGVLAVHRASLPVVSVGALAVGGSGKTPFVLWLASRLRADGISCCIVTRGYGAAAPSREPFLLDGERARDPEAVARAGDEAVLLALRSGAPVAVGADRVAACGLAARELARRGHPVQLFLLDDGFQHRRLARDLDIVLLRGDESSRSVLPAGPLREAQAALSRADVVVATGEGDIVARRGPAPVLRAEARPSCLVSSVSDTAGEDLSALSGRRVAAVAAIARPQRFLADLERCGATIAARMLYRDHHRFDDEDLRRISAAAAAADLVVTTEKDLVKLAGLRDVRALRIEMEVHDGHVLLHRIAQMAAADSAHRSARGI